MPPATRCMMRRREVATERLPDEVHDLDAVLTELGIGDVRQLWRAFCNSGAPQNTSVFVGWLRAEGVVNDDQLVVLLARLGIATTKPEEWSNTAGPTAQSRFAMLGKLGAGAMGEVLLAHDERLGRIVALKSMRAHLASDQALLGRFVLEAQISAQLEHPNIVPVYTMERTDEGSFAFTMKMVQGRNMEEFLEVSREQEAAGGADADHQLEARIDLFLKVCDAMSFAHERGVVHRDLKPENIMIGAHGEVYVMDWGVAKLVGVTDAGMTAMRELEWGQDGPGKTQVGVAIGTPSFMSPEQASGKNDELSPASDQYAMGLILFELVTLKRANTGPTAIMTTLRAQMAEKDEFVHALGRSLPVELGAIIDRATQPEPFDRYESVDHLADDLRRFVRNEPTVALPDSRVRSLTRWMSRNSARAAFMVMSLVLVAVVGASSVGLVSLSAVIQSQRIAAEREHRTAELISAVSRRAHVMDMDLFEHQSLVERLAMSTARLLEREPDNDERVYTLADLKSGDTPLDWAPSDKYEQSVSFDYPVNVGAPDAPVSELAADIRALAPLRHDMRMVFSGAFGDPPPGQPPHLLRGKVDKKEVPLPWVYVGLESGLIVNYPGNALYSPEFDTRKRPWYTMAVGSTVSVWGPPVPDDSGLGSLVPCTSPVIGTDGTFYGVAGVANGLKHMVEELRIERLQSFQKAGYLVTPDGRIVLQTGDEVNKDIDAGLYGNQADSLLPFPDSSLVDALGEGDGAGKLRIGDDILVFSRLESLGWFLVVRVDGAGLDTWEL